MLRNGLQMHGNMVSTRRGVFLITTVLGCVVVQINSIRAKNYLDSISWPDMPRLGQGHRSYSGFLKSITRLRRTFERYIIL